MLRTDSRFTNTSGEQVTFLIGKKFEKEGRKAFTFKIDDVILC